MTFMSTICLTCNPPLHAIHLYVQSGYDQLNYVREATFLNACPVGPYKIQLL